MKFDHRRRKSPRNENTWQLLQPSSMHVTLVVCKLIFDPGAKETWSPHPLWQFCFEAEREAVNLGRSLAKALEVVNCKAAATYVHNGPLSVLAVWHRRKSPLSKTQRLKHARTPTHTLVTPDLCNQSLLTFTTILFVLKKKKPRTLRLTLWGRESQSVRHQERMPTFFCLSPF